MALDVTEESAGVRGVLLLSRPSCLSQWKVLFWWNRWKQSMLKGVVATNSLWARKYVRTRAHLGQNRGHPPVVCQSLFFCVRLLYSYYSWSVHLPIFVCHSLLFSVCHPLYSPFPFVCCVSAQYLITLILFIKEHAHTMPLFPRLVLKPM